MARSSWAATIGAVALMALAPLMIFGLTGVPAVAATLPSGCTQGTPGGIVTCTYTSAGQSVFDVPAGVTEVTVTAIGAPGGDGSAYADAGGEGGVGGLGAEVTATLIVTPSSVLYVEVGGPGGNGEGGNACAAGSAGVNGGGGGGVARCDSGGGGGGGGESDVRSAPAASGGLTGAPGDPRLVVAGGGGGGGGSYSHDGGAGGNAGETSVAGAGNGGNAGTCTGFPGGGSGNGDPGTAGGVGVGGGAGGGPSCTSFSAFGSAGTATAGGTGGNGNSVDAAGGGGGGGGYIGGGGGGALANVGGGGGGGSSYAPPGGTITTAAAGMAASVTITYTPAPLPQMISFSAPGSGVVGTTATLSATGGGSGNPVMFNTTTTSVCSLSGVNGATVRYLAAGTCTIDADQAGGDGYSAAVPVSQSITVDQSPAFTSATSAAFRVGTAGTFTVSASGFPVPAVTEHGALPAGVTFTAGKLSGTPASGSAGTYAITFTAVNAAGSVIQDFTLTVDKAQVTPAVTPPQPVTLITGPPEAPPGRSPLLPVGIGMVGLGAGGVAIEEILRRRARRRS